MFYQCHEHGKRRRDPPIILVFADGIPIDKESVSQILRELSEEFYWIKFSARDQLVSLPWDFLALSLKNIGDAQYVTK